MSIKLSETQHGAMVEISKLGYTVAKANTIKSLENKGLINPINNTHHELTSQGREYLGLPAEDFHTKLMADVESLESLLQGDPWKLGDAITEDEAYIVLDSDGGLEDAEGTEFDKFDDKWDDSLKVTAGFGATLDWRGTEVWNGLTAAEIKEDMDSATPVNRTARRTHFRTLRNAFRRQTVQRPRKALKVTGKVGV